MLNRWIERDRLLDTLEDAGVGCIVFSPLAQGMLTGKYLKGVPADSRAKAGKSLNPDFLSKENLARIGALNDIAKARGQTLAQMALAWVLRDPRVTSALIGASRPEQVRDAVGALQRLDFGKKELKEIDRYATEGGINIWKQSSSA
jgi:L-glyceraldehyde 3-phosphate reductase